MMAEQNSDNLFTLPDDPEKLKLLVADYSRRLQNALHTVEAQKQTLIKNSIQHEEFSKKLNRANRLLELEIAKNVNLARRKQQDDESKRYERTRLRAEKLHEEFRLATIDHQISQAPREPIRITKLKNALAEIEAKLDSQKLLLRHLSKTDELVEELCQCAQTGDIQGASNLINVKGVSLHVTDQSGYLPLHYAISNGHIEMVRLFLECGVDATCYLSGYSSMEIAARYGEIDCIYELLRYGIGVEEAGASGITDHIQLKGPTKHTDHAGMMDTMGVAAAGVGNGNSSRNSSGHNKGDSTNTPLMSAIRCSQVECAAELISLGANIYIRDNNRNNILHICASILPNHADANGNVVGVDGRKEKQTQKQRDANNAPIEMLKLLLSYDSNIMVPLLFDENLMQQTPLRMSIDNNNPELTKFLNPYYLEQNEAQNYYNSLDSSTSLSRSKTHNNNGLDSGPGPGPGQIAYLPAHEKEARFLAQEEEQYSHRIGVNGVLMGRLHQHGGGDFDHNRGGEEYIDLPQASQKIPQTRTLPLRTKTTLFNQVYRVSGGGDSTDAQNNDGGVMVGGNTKKSNIQPVNHFRDLSTNITTTADGTFVAGPPAATVVIAAGSSGAIAPKGGKQSVPVGIGMSVNDSVYSGTGGHTRKGPGKGGAADVHKNSQQQQGVTHSHKKGKNIDGSDSLFNENFDHGGSVVSALTMISQHEDHDGLQ